jgi:hypothetical protein
VEFFDVFRLRPDGSFVWIASADSIPTAHKVIKSLNIEPSDAFLIHDSQQNRTLTVRAGELPPP